MNITGQLNNSGSTLLVDSPSNNFGLAGGTITGGTISTANGQRFTQVAGNSTLAGVSVPGDVTIASGSLTATGTTAFTGEVAIGAGLFQVPSGSTIPSGSFRFTGSPAGVMRAAPSGTAATFTLGPAVMVHGGGTGTGATLGTQTPDNTTINNYGTISADVPGQILTVNAFLNNYGTIQAVNGGELDTTYIQQAGHALASGPGSVLVLYGAPYTITAPLSVSDGGRLVLASNWTNSSTINIDHATLDLGGNFGPSGFNGIVNNGGNVRITGTLDARGLPLTIPTGLNLSVPYQLWSGTLTIPASETVNVSGTLSQSVLTGGGAIVLANGNITGPQGAPATFNIGSGITITGYGSGLGHLDHRLPVHQRGNNPRRHRGTEHGRRLERVCELRNAGGCQRGPAHHRRLALEQHWAHPLRKRLLDHPERLLHVRRRDHRRRGDREHHRQGHAEQRRGDADRDGQYPA